MTRNSNTTTDEKSSGWLGKRDFIEWAVIIGIGVVLYTTGLHTEVLGRLQQAVLWTGIMQPDMEAPASEQKVADLNMPLVTLDGERLNLSDYKGKVVFLNYWATWCPPCIAEMPNIQALYSQYQDSDDIEFIMVSMDGEAERAQEFIAQKEYDFPVYRLAGSRPASLHSTVLPTTFVIDKAGKIVVEQRGMANYNTMPFNEFLDSLTTSQPIKIGDQSQPIGKLPAN